MIQHRIPDYYIHIGIENDKVVSIDHEDITWEFKNKKDIKLAVIKYLKLAIKMVKDK